MRRIIFADALDGIADETDASRRKIRNAAVVVEEFAIE